MVAEIIREKIMRTIGSEVPYQIAVEIDSYKVDQEKILSISMLVYLLREIVKKVL